MSPAQIKAALRALAGGLANMVTRGKLLAAA